MTAYRRCYEGRTYCFTVVTYERRPILTTELGRRCLREAFAEVRAARPFRDVASVLLPDHLHAVWELPRDDRDYSDRWRRIKTGFTKRWRRAGGGEAAVSASRRAKGEGGLWQRRFWEHRVRDEVDLKRCCDYVHINRLKHEVVDRVVDWPWSTFHRFVREGEYDESWGNVALFGDEFDAFE